MTLRTLLALVLIGLAPLAQAFPDKPLRIVVPYPAGGGSDIVTRHIAENMGRHLGQPVVVENRAGASGNIGMEVVKAAPPDGYTMVLGTAGQAINMSFFPKLGYDFVRDFLPVSLLVKNQRMLVVGRTVTATTLAAFVADARANPNKITFASFGNGSSAHMAAEMIKMQARIEMIHVPYRGDRPALNDLLAGSVDSMVGDVASLLPHVQSGKLRALGIASPQRFPGLPDVPTLAEAGLPGFEASGWLGLFVPAGTPRPAIETLNGAVARTLADANVRRTLQGLGADPEPNSPTEFARFVRNEIDKWARVVRASGARPD